MKKQALDERLKIYVKNDGNKRVVSNKFLFTASAVAGAGAILIPPPAEAAIVYSGTNQNKVLSQANPITKTVDFDGDNIVDFGFKFTYSTTSTFYSHMLEIVPGNEVVATISNGPAYLVGNFLVSNNRNFSPDASYLANFSGTTGSGNFRDNTGYLGVRFRISGATHYGWIQFEVSENANKGTIIDWAYEDVAGKSIKAGATKDFNWNLFLPAITAGNKNK